jgi:hypothetical protein
MVCYKLDSHLAEKEIFMKAITLEEVQAGFQMLGLATEEERANFTRFAPESDEETQEFTRLDVISEPQENLHAELA